MNPQPVQNSSILNQGMQGISNTVSSLKNGLQNTMNEFASQPNAPSEFSYSNTIIAKFAFLILVIIMFMFLINLGIILITYLTTTPDNPYVVKGLLGGTNAVTIPQDPKLSNSVTLMRSNNKSKGAEFTWSVWLFINDVSPDNNKYQHIFNKGNNLPNEQNIASVNNAPGLYLGNPRDPDNKNTLHIIMDTVDPMNQNNTIDINNIPLNKWINVVIRLENTTLDVYINGTISSRLILDNVPKQNYNDVFVCRDGGFTGNLSDLRYFSSALNVFEISTIVSKGPNLETSGLSANTQHMNDYSYLSNMWYWSKTDNNSATWSR